MSQNGYSYTNDNPVMNVDPDGEYVQYVLMEAYFVYKVYKVRKVYKTAKGVKRRKK